MIISLLYVASSPPISRERPNPAPAKASQTHQKPRHQAEHHIAPPLLFSQCEDYQSSSSAFLLAMAFFLANNASASPPLILGVGVLLLLPSVEPAPPLRLNPESRAAGAGAGVRLLAAGLLTGGWGGVGFALPLGGGGGGRDEATGGGGGSCSST